jgi:hypothetical protein
MKQLEGRGHRILASLLPLCTRLPLKGSSRKSVCSTAHSRGLGGAIRHVRSCHAARVTTTSGDRRRNSWDVNTVSVGEKRVFRLRWCTSGVQPTAGTHYPCQYICVSPANGLIPERRRRDSNPRYPVKRYNTLAGCRLQPLGHSSVSRGVYQKGRGRWFVSRPLGSCRRRPRR